MCSDFDQLLKEKGEQHNIEAVLMKKYSRCQMIP